MSPDYKILFVVSNEQIDAIMKILFYIYNHNYNLAREL